MVDPPRYSIPPGLFASLLLSWIRLSPRNFRSDALACTAGISPTPQISGRAYIPSAGPCLVTFNHYSRPGFNIMWLVMALCAALPVDGHVIMTGEFTYPGKWYGPLSRPLSRLVLKRLARIYGFNSMPPMPPRPQDVTERARSVREVLSWLDRTKTPMLLLSPEGGDAPGGCLSRPPAGVGRFISLVASRGLSILPVAGWEESGVLCLRFGPTYQLELAGASGLTRDEMDSAASEVVMRAIAALLPPDLRGDFQ